MTTAIGFLSAVCGILVVAELAAVRTFQQQRTDHYTLVRETRQAFADWAAAFDTAHPDGVNPPDDLIHVPDEAPEPT